MEKKSNSENSKKSQEEKAYSEETAKVEGEKTYRGSRDASCLEPLSSSFCHPAPHSLFVQRPFVVVAIIHMVPVPKV
jgi:hypothetical protein